MSAPQGLYALVLLTAFAAVLITAYTVACTPAAEPNLLGIRGLKRVRALQSSSLFAALEPGLRWLGRRARPLLGASLERSLDRRLTLAGDVFGITPAEFVALMLLCAALGSVCGLAFTTLTLDPHARAALFALFGAIFPYGRLGTIQEERSRRAEEALPPLMDLLVLCLSAGLDLPGALHNVVAQSSNPDDALTEELGFVLQELRVGKTRKVALTQLAERLPTNSVREFVTTIIQAEERGNPLARVLAIHAEVARRERSVRAEEAASKAGVKMMLPMVMIFAAVMCLMIGPLVLKMR